MKPVKAIRITVAAGILGVGPKILLRELRARNILDANNMPAREYMEVGQLGVEFISYRMGGTGILKYFAAPTVTIAGHSLIALIAQDIRHGTAKKIAQEVSNENSPPPHQFPKDIAHARIAEIMQILSEDACEADVRAA